jgi:hypothetical protein
MTVGQGKPANTTCQKPNKNDVFRFENPLEMLIATNFCDFPLRMAEHV